MANEKTLELLKKMKADPKAKELFEGMGKPTSPDEAISAYAQVAEKLGYGITVEDIREAIKQEETIRKAKTDKVVADMDALEDDDLEGVAGGFYSYELGSSKDCTAAMLQKVYDKCADNFTDANCYISDACENYVNFYYDCSGEYFEAGADQNCILNQFWS